MQAEAFVGKHSAAAKHHFHRRRQSTSVARRCTSQIGLEIRCQRLGEALVPFRHEGTGMVEDGAKIGPGTAMLGGQRANAGPAGRRIAKLTEPLMQFGEPDQRHQMALVRLQR